MALEAVMPRSMVASTYEHLVRVSQCETEQVCTLLRLAHRGCCGPPSLGPHDVNNSLKTISRCYSHGKGGLSFRPTDFWEDSNGWRRTPKAKAHHPDYVS